MRYNVDIIGELTLDLGLEVVDQLRSVYEFNKLELETYIEPNTYDEVEIVICSNGGEFRALSLIMDEVNKLKEQGVKIITRGSSMCYSVGFYLMLLGDERVSNNLCSFMIHEFQLSTGYDSLTGNDNYIQHQKKIQENLDNWVIENTKITKEMLLEYKQKDRWMTYDECIELGILTEPKEKEEIIMTEQEAIKCMKEYGYTVVSEKEFAEMTKLQV